MLITVVTLTTIEQGAEAVSSVMMSETTGEFYKGKKVSKAIPQAYDDGAREKLKRITFDILRDYL